MKIQKTIQALEAKGYQVKYFAEAEEAVSYLENSLHGKTIGFGGSATLEQLKLGERLAKNNSVFDPDHPEAGETFRSTALKAMDTECYMLSANGLSMDGVIVNLDGTGNRLAGSLFGHKKIYYVIGTNKIEEDLERTIWRVRNIAAPKNAARFHLKTPCAQKGGLCCDCKSTDRICNSLLLHLAKIDSAEVEVVLIDQELGF